MKLVASPEAVARARGGGGHASRLRAFALVEVCVALFLLAVALGTLVGSVFYALRLEDVNEETAGANQLAQSILEDMHAMPFEEIFAAYNADPSDDPLPGHDYLGALTASERRGVLGKKGGAVATVTFPGDGIQLREDVVDAGLGMPRDLDGDGIDADDHADDYRLLPIRLRLDWEGAGGARSYEITTLLRSP